MASAGAEAPDLLAEDAGFEPARVLTQHDFQSCCVSSVCVLRPVLAGVLARPYCVRTDLSLPGGYHGGYHAEINLPTTLCGASSRPPFAEGGEEPAGRPGDPRGLPRCSRR